MPREIIIKIQQKKQKIVVKKKYLGTLINEYYFNYLLVFLCIKKQVD